MKLRTSSERRRLKYAATVNDEALPEETDPDFQLQYVDIGNVDSEGAIHQIANYRFADAPSRARRKVRDGDVIVSTVRTYLQAIAPIVEPPGNLIVSTGFAVVRPNKGILDAGFCKFALREPKFLWEVQARSVGVTYPAINSSELQNIQIAMPAITKQKQIAKYLDAETAQIDSLVSEKEDMLRLLTQKRTTLISSLVTRGVDYNAKLKATCVGWVDSIPTAWEMRRCANLFTEIDERNEPELPLLNVSLNTGVTLRTFSDDRIESVAEDFATYKVARKNDLVANRMRFWQGAVGIAPVDGLTSPDYMVARMGKELLPAYVELLFRTPQFSSEVKRYSHGMVDDRLRLYWDKFKTIRIPVPPIAEQRRIVEAVEREVKDISEVEETLTQSIALLKERRGALIAAAVTGEIEVQG